MATVKNSLDVPQETKNTATVWPSNFTPEYISKGNEEANLKRSMHPMFTAALFIVV